MPSRFSEKFSVKTGVRRLAAMAGAELAKRQGLAGAHVLDSLDGFVEEDQVDSLSL
jgi:hypothetical protein